MGDALFILKIGVEMKKRDSRFEIIRILSMVLIVAYHYTMYGGWTIYNSVKI